MAEIDCKPRARRAVACALAVAMTLAAGPAAAAGFAVGQTSVSGAGSAFAGGAAAGGDASTLFSNPAGATRLGDSEIVFGGSLVLPRIAFRERGSTLFDGSPLGGNDGGDGGFEVVAPNLYALWDYAEHLKFGLGITVPFGLVTDYELGWLGRYNETTTTFQTIDVNPNVAIKLTTGVVVGRRGQRAMGARTAGPGDRFRDDLRAPGGGRGLWPVDGDVRRRRTGAGTERRRRRGRGRQRRAGLQFRPVVRILAEDPVRLQLPLAHPSQVRTPTAISRSPRRRARSSMPAPRRPRSPTREPSSISICRKWFR